MSISELLSRYQAPYFAAHLERSAALIVGEHGFFPNEIGPAIDVICQLRAGKRSILVAQPMQSGKTNIISAATLLLKDCVLGVRAVYICANDQLDFRRQNFLELAPHVEVLTRADRKKWEQGPNGEKLIVFYDENHFGDGSKMTVSQFLSAHSILDNPQAVFVGVSATPFSSLNSLETTIWPDMEALDVAGYNSPGRMLMEGRIRDADPMFWAPLRRQLGRSPIWDEVTIEEECEAYAHLRDLLDGPRDARAGYCLIRCKRWEGEALEAHLKERWGDAVFVVHWNQHNRQFDPTEFFRRRRPGVVTVVLVQHKARMGNVIATDHCHFFYEYSPKASVDTIAQSFIGRACGFGKKDHAAIVYSRRTIARAYDILISSNGDTALFAAYCLREGLRPAIRTQIAHGRPRYRLEEVKVFRVSPETDLAEIRQRCAALRARYGLEDGRGSIRTLSKTANPIRGGMIDVTGRRARDRAAVKHCGADPGDWSIVVFDEVDQGGGSDRPMVRHKTIQLAMRGSKLGARLTEVGPSVMSLHHGIRANLASRGQLSLNLRPGPAAAGQLAGGPAV